MKKHFPFKKSVVILSLFTGCFSLALNAQTVIKVGASQGNNQTTIQHAYDSLVVAPLTGAYVIELQSDYDPAAEKYPITFKNKTGASATNSITIRPATGVKKTISNPATNRMFTGLSFSSGANSIQLPDAQNVAVGQAVYGIGVPAFLGTNSTTDPYRNDTITSVDPATGWITLASATTGTVTGTTLFVGKPLSQTILFYGAKYITIDGVSRTDANTGLTIQNPNFINCQTIMFTNGSQYNTVKNCYIKGANQTGQINNGTCGQIFMNTGENSFNTIDNNDICDIDGSVTPITLINMCAISGSSNHDNTFSNNNMYNIGTGTSANGNAGFFQFPSGNGTNTHHNYVLNNKMYWTKPVSMNTGMSCIGVGGSHNGEGNRIEGNVIGFGAPDGTGSATITALPTQAALQFSGIVNARNATVKNNTIGGIFLTAKAFVGITTNTYSATSFVADDYFVGNKVKDIVMTATASGATATCLSINSASAFSASVKNNKVDNVNLTGLPTFVCTVTGLEVAGTPVGASALTYSDNSVSNLTAGDGSSTAANIAYGMKVNWAATSVNANMIYNINAINNTNTTIVRGLQVAGSSVVGQLFTNNIVRLGSFFTNDASIIAFYHGAATTAQDGFKLYNNTFYIGGTAPSGAKKSTYVYFRPTGNTQANDFQNNIFANKRVVAAQESHYAMQINAATDLTVSDYNLFQFGANLGYVSTLTAAAPDLAIWQSQNLDAHSLAVDPQFEAPEALIPDMRIKSTSPAKGAGANLLSTVSKDFNGFVRTSNDIGALTFGSIASGINPVSENKLTVLSGANGIILGNVSGKTVSIFSTAGRLVKTASVSSDRESISLEKGFYIVRVDGKVTKVMVK